MVTNSLFDVNRLFCIFLKINELFSVHAMNYLNIQNMLICKPFFFKYKKRNYRFRNNSFYDPDIRYESDISCKFYSSTIESLLPTASFGIGFASTQILPGRPASFAPLKTTVRCPSVSKLDWAISPTAVMRYSF